MIQSLREDEEVLLYNNILKIEEDEASKVVEFLELEYATEVLNYPYKTIEFDSEAALWAAKTVYVAAQLILYRENKEIDLEILLPKYKLELTASAIVSSDLCLRFLPDMIVQLRMIDPEDLLIEVLDNILLQCHYSGISYELEVEKLNFTAIEANKCLHQLYANRIANYRKLRLAEHPVFNELISANLGIYGNELWNNFKKNTEVNG